MDGGNGRTTAGDVRRAHHIVHAGRDLQKFRDELLTMRPVLEILMKKRSIFLSVIAPLLIIVACADRDDSAGTETGTQAGDISYAPIPESILTPDSVDSRIGTLEFFDGYPSVATVDATYDNLDFQRGVRAFLDANPITSLYAMREGMKGMGLVNGTVGIFESLLDSRTLFLTANTESIYAFEKIGIIEMDNMIIPPTHPFACNVVIHIPAIIKNIEGL